MLIGQRLRDIREMKNLSQDDIEKGLVRPYISRVENGHTVPSIETLQKWAGALGMQLYQVLYEGEEPPKPPHPGPSSNLLTGAHSIGDGEPPQTARYKTLQFRS